MREHHVPEVVCFDAYGTLLELLDPVERLRAALLAAGYEYDAGTVGEAFAAEIAFYRRNQDRGADTVGLRALRTLCAAVFADTLPDGPPHGVMLEILGSALRYRLYDDVVSTLDALAGAGLRLAIISNWDCSLPGVLIELGVADRFHVVSASAVVGSRKPARRIFDGTLAALGCAPGRAVHVGDDPELDIAGATGAGLRGIHLDRVSRFPLAPGERIGSLSELPNLLLP